MSRLKRWWKRLWCQHTTIRSDNDGPWFCDHCGKPHTFEPDYVKVYKNGRRTAGFVGDE